MSATTTSGLYALAIRTSARASAAAPTTSNPPSWRTCTTPSRTKGWSSPTRTRICCGGLTAQNYAVSPAGTIPHLLGALRGVLHRRARDAHRSQPQPLQLRDPAFLRHLQPSAHLGAQLGGGPVQRGVQPAITGLLLNTQVLNRHAEDRIARCIGKRSRHRTGIKIPHNR